MPPTDWFPLCPEPPTWRVDWTAIDAAFPWVQGMRGCPQDPLYHGEGDVWVHTRMVCEALSELPTFRQSPPEERQLLFTAALLHDVAKPSCTREGLDGKSPPGDTRYEERSTHARSCGAWARPSPPVSRSAASCGSTRCRSPHRSARCTATGARDQSGDPRRPSRAGR